MGRTDNVLDALEIAVVAMFFGAAVIISMTLLGFFNNNISYAADIIDVKQSVRQSSAQVYAVQSPHTENTISREQAIDMVLSLDPDIDLTIQNAGGSTTNISTSDAVIINARGGDEASIRRVAGYFTNAEYVQRNIYDNEEITDASRSSVIDHRDLLTNIILEGIS